MMDFFRQLDSVSRLFLVSFLSMVFFLLTVLLLSLLAGEKFSLAVANFSNEKTALINLSSIVLALALGFLFSLRISLPKEARAFSIVSNTVNADEKMVLEEVKKVGVITQDSLRFRLDWSKAKLSTILSNLDKKGLIVRERSGKTYKVMLPDYYKKFGV